MQLKPLQNKILFQFLDKIRNKNFVNNTEWGFELKDVQNTNVIKEPRWVKICAVGSEVTNVKVGDYALVYALKWTEEVKFLGESYWQTDSEQLLISSKTLPNGIR